MSFFRSVVGFLVGPAKPPTPTPVVSTSRTTVPGPLIAFVNRSTVVTDIQIATIVDALQVQVDRDFAPIWKMDANLVAVPKTSAPPTAAWIIYIMDTSDQPGALGYHDLTKAGNP